MFTKNPDSSPASIVVETPIYSELSVRSAFSGLSIAETPHGVTYAYGMQGWPGSAQPETLVERASVLGLSAVALTDIDTVAGVVRAHRHALQVGIRLIVGAELLLQEGSLLLHVMNAKGYSNLCQLLTKARAGLEKGQIRHRLDLLCEHSEGLFATITPPFQWDIEPLRRAFDTRLSIGVFFHQHPEDDARLIWAKRLSAHFDIPLLATARACLADKDEKLIHDVLTCIHQGISLGEAGQRLMPNAEACLKSPIEMKALFGDLPMAFRRAEEVASLCQFSLSELSYSFPSKASASEEATPHERLEALTWERAQVRYQVESREALPAAVVSQLIHELRLIHSLGLAPYFLTTLDIVEIARERKILFQGRGSAANSAVCYCLGITAIDPVHMGLLFERFISAERGEPPDIDVDFEHERREEVIQAIYEKYGRDHAGMVCNVTTFRGKSAIREVGKVLGVPESILSRLASFVGRRGTTQSFVEACRALGVDPEQESLQQTWRIASRLIGFPRHLSIHVGGFILTNEPIHTIAPVEPGRMEGRTIIPFDKDDVSQLGFFKMDVLGLGMLTCIRKAFALVREHYGQSYELHTIQQDDAKVYDALCRADTIGVFQVESRAQMSMLPRLRPRNFFDLVVQVAIIRPGPIQGGMVHPYLKRRSGKEHVHYPHDRLKPILEKTLGVPIFQEQVMRVAMVGANYSPGEADQLRRDMATWKKGGELKHHRQRLMAGFQENGISPEWAEQLYRQLIGFGEYGFPESHAASFAVLVYASAWLKVHFPAAFATALLNSQPMGFYTPSQIVTDAQRHRVEVRPVSINHSGWDSTLELDAEKTSWVIRLGLRTIKGLSYDAVQDTLIERECHGPFSGLDDFLYRCGLNLTMRKALAHAGALDELTTHRREAILSAFETAMPLFPKGIKKKKTAKLLPPREDEILQLDFTHVGISLNDHPMRHLRPYALDVVKAWSGRCTLLSLDAVHKERSNRRVVCAGMVTLRQKPHSANGTCFLTLEDETEMLNVIVWPRQYEEWKYIIVSNPYLIVVGRLEREGSVAHVIAEEIHPLSRGAPFASDQSRNFR